MKIRAWKGNAALLIMSYAGQGCSVALSHAEALDFLREQIEALDLTPSEVESLFAGVPGLYVEAHT